VEWEIQSWGYGADGADALSLAVILAGLTGLFLSGKKIEENLDAWIRLGERLRKAIGRLRRRGVAARLSEPAAVAVAIANAVSNQPPASGVSSCRAL
jgi:hypothetical protein